MPIYEFECPSCKSKVEILQSYKDSPPICNACALERKGRRSMKRILGRFSFELRGNSGFYDSGFSGYSVKKGS